MGLPEKMRIKLITAEMIAIVAAVPAFWFSIQKTFAFSGSREKLPAVDASFALNRLTEAAMKFQEISGYISFMIR